MDMADPFGDDDTGESTCKHPDGCHRDALARSWYVPTSLLLMAIQEMLAASYSCAFHADLPVDVYVHNIMKFLVDFVEENLRPTVAKEGRDFHDKEWAERHANDESKKKIQQTVHHATRIELNVIASKLNA